MVVFLPLEKEKSIEWRSDIKGSSSVLRLQEWRCNYCQNINPLFKIGCIRALDTECDRFCRCTDFCRLIQIESENSNLFTKSNQSPQSSFLFQLFISNQPLLTTLKCVFYCNVSFLVRSLGRLSWKTCLWTFLAMSFSFRRPFVYSYTAESTTKWSRPVPNQCFSPRSTFSLPHCHLLFLIHKKILLALLQNFRTSKRYQKFYSKTATM